MANGKTLGDYYAKGSTTKLTLDQLKDYLEIDETGAIKVKEGKKCIMQALIQQVNW